MPKYILEIDNCYNNHRNNSRTLNNNKSQVRVYMIMKVVSSLEIITLTSRFLAPVDPLLVALVVICNWKVQHFKE